MTRTRLCLLRGFDLLVDDVQVELPANAQRLVAFLALTDRPLQRAHVAGYLWMEKSEERAAANLRTTLWRLRQSGQEFVEADGTRLRLSDEVAVDVHAAQALCRRLFDGVDAVEARWADELTGELLPDWYDDWVVLDRERLRQLFLHALERLCTRLCRAGRIGQAIDVAFRAVGVEPLRESAHRTLIGAYLAEGNQSEALRHYEQYHALLTDQLHLEPSDALTAMVEPLGVRAG